MEVFYGGDQLDRKLVDSDLARSHFVEVPPETGPELLKVNRWSTLIQTNAIQLGASFTLYLHKLLVDLDFSIVQSLSPVVLNDRVLTIKKVN